MTFFSRCDASQVFEATPRRMPLRRAKPSAGGLRRAVWGFAEDLGILARYAVGLDYYGRDRVGTGR